MLSMTGFGRSEKSTEHYKVEIEIKSVNHRYLDLNTRLPRALNFLDLTIRGKIKEYVSRGKIDIFVYFEDFDAESENITYNHDIAAAYMSGIQKISEDFSLPVQMSAYQLSRFPDVFSNEEPPLDEEMISELVTDVLAQAADAFIQSRRAEGERLKKDILEKMSAIRQMVDEIAVRAPEMLTEYREKIHEKVKELLGDTQIDENVLATEMVVYSDKVCVDEEMVRLKAHIVHMQETLQSEESIGRKLDFLTQEMNRETNTILSKSNDIKVSDLGIALKTEIEKLREQIQNIE